MIDLGSVRGWVRVITASLALGGMACSQDREVLAVGSGGVLGNYTSVATAIARVVNRADEGRGVRLESAPTAGSIANINAVLSGEMAFGLAQADLQYEAVRGLGAWEHVGPRSELRAVFSLYTEAITVVATPGSGIRDTSDLPGKIIDIGHPDSGIRQSAVAVLSAAARDWHTRSTVFESSPDDRANMYLGGQLDAFFHVVGHPTTDITFAVNSVPRARLVPLAHVEELLAAHPYYVRSTIPVALYPGIENEADVETVGVKAVLLTSAAVPKEVVYTVAKAVCERIETLGEFDPVLRDLTIPDLLEGMIAPIHPGALDYYRDAGLQPGT